MQVEEKPLYDEDRPPEVELKLLHSSLRYEFLGPNSTYPVIVNASSDACQVDSFPRVLREYRKAIGYALNDLKGIHPSVCMHRFLM